MIQQNQLSMATDLSRLIIIIASGKTKLLESSDKTL